MSRVTAHHARDAGSTPIDFGGSLSGLHPQVNADLDAKVRRVWKTSQMAPRKEPKEAIVYPSSKRKALPFKPHRPTKLPRIPTSDTESTNPRETVEPETSRSKSRDSTQDIGASNGRSKRPTKIVASGAQRKAGSMIEDEDDGDEDEDEELDAVAGVDSTDSDEELDANPLAAKRKPSKPLPMPRKAFAPQAVKPARATSLRSDASDESPSELPGELPSTRTPTFQPSQAEGVPFIPQPLLVRLLHEHFADKTTKIDKHAIEVLQKYFEVFIRETIARVQLHKQEAAEKAADPSEVDASWLELDDLDRVAAGMLLDF